MKKDEAVKWLEMLKEEYSKGTRYLSTDALTFAVKYIKDSVSKEAYQQIQWERDQAVTQLKELGYKVGQEVVIDNEPISRTAALECLECQLKITGKGNVEKIVEYLNDVQEKILSLPTVSFPFPSGSEPKDNTACDEVLEHWKRRFGSLPALENKYEYHTDHTDCIWYGSGSGCPVTCSQYRDGWNDAIDYIFKEGKGYQPYKRGTENDT